MLNLRIRNLIQRSIYHYLHHYRRDTINIKIIIIVIITYVSLFACR